MIASHSVLLKLLKHVLLLLLLPLLLMEKGSMVNEAADAVVSLGVYTQLAIACHVMWCSVLLSRHSSSSRQL
jgi:polyferredoxin